jgi:hypothetical protein
VTGSSCTIPPFASVHSEGVSGVFDDSDTRAIAIV